MIRPSSRHRRDFSHQAKLRSVSSHILFDSLLSTDYSRVLENRSPLETTHAHPESPESSTSGIQIPPSRHIILPFNLRQNRTAFHGANSELLYRLFPDTKSVSFDGYFLVFWLSALPPKPWPVTIAGVQPYFTIDPNDDGPTPPIKRASKSILRVSDEIDATNLPPGKIDDAFELVKNFFAQAKISITEVQYWNIFFVIILENEETDLAKVPSAIGRCRCFYLFENEMGRPRPDEFPARQICDPTGNIVDNGEYDILRPGVMVSSGRDPTTHIEYLTSSGVLVEDSRGNRYMTVASHGFPHGDTVFHPSAGCKNIGQIIMEISHTDVALVKLHDEVQFVNETFESPLDGAGPVQLQEFIPADETQVGSFVYMNNPFAGYSEGTCGPHSWTRVPSDDPNDPDWNGSGLAGPIWVKDSLINSKMAYVGPRSGLTMEKSLDSSVMLRGRDISGIGVSLSHLTMS